MLSIEDSVTADYRARRFHRIARVAARLRHREPNLSLIICPGTTQPGLPVKVFPENSGLEGVCSASLQESLEKTEDLQGSVSTHSGRILYYAHRADFDLQPRHDQAAGQAPAKAEAPPILVIAQDLSGLRNRWLEVFGRTFGLTWLGGLLLLTLAAGQTRVWLRRQLETIRRTRVRPFPRLMKELPKEPSWLVALKQSLRGHQLVVVSNREPYIHQRKGDRVEIIRPASGLVTALEPILRAVGGLWIAHGSGSADREAADERDEVAVPPGKPSYRLKRVWLSAEEENGYYYGFSNEGLWPLCHLAHTRPIFRLSDWESYRVVNGRFGEAIPDSLLNPRSIILVQDYHFALLPQMIRSRCLGREKDAPRIAVFWHIPWPNPEAFGICPWNSELLKGMLGADVIGFHTQYHCNNFLETCNRYLEARIDYEKFSVTMENRETLIRAFPIGIDTAPVRTLSDTEREALKDKYGIHASFIAVGVDRLDYTKGIIERIEAVERFLEKHPEQVGKFALVQMGSPSRSQIPAYQALVDSLTSTVERVNQRFGRPDGYKPVYLLHSHHEWDEIQYFYQLGDLCMVTSLHDGMNLVAKEYVWCQRPDRGSLILSKFTGASRELNDAFIVNPYSIEEMADAIARAVSLTREERTRRMISMRAKVEARSAYHWAADLIRSTIPKDEISGLRTELTRLSGRSSSAARFGG
jgi:trehalose 6-phosphate synthase